MQVITTCPVCKKKHNIPAQKYFLPVILVLLLDCLGIHVENIQLLPCIRVSTHCTEG